MRKAFPAREKVFFRTISVSALTGIAHIPFAQPVRRRSIG